MLRGLLGCSAILAFVVMFAVSLVATKCNFRESWMIGLMGSSMAFIASLILSIRDSRRHTRAKLLVKDSLLKRDDGNPNEFAESLPNIDTTLIGQTQNAVAKYFDVPVPKLRATDSLSNDLQAAVFEPGFHMFVLYEIFNARDVVPQSFSFDARSLSDFNAFTVEIARILDGLKSTTMDGNCNAPDRDR